MVTYYTYLKTENNAYKNNFIVFKLKVNHFITKIFADLIGGFDHLFYRIIFEQGNNVEQKEAISSF